MESLSIKSKNSLDKPFLEPFLHALKLFYPYQRQINEIAVKFKLNWSEAVSTLCPVTSVETEWANLKKLDIKAVSISSPNYPRLLKEVVDAPTLLYYRGALPYTTVNLSVVGSRKITTYGARCIEYLFNDLFDQPVTIVSGLAYGVDTKAHQTALTLGMNTAAILGSGLDKASLYPYQNYGLAEKILASGGCLISEFPPGIKARPGHFPLRNRIVAGCSDAVLIVEASRDSGSLITARLAKESQRQIFAIPNDIFETQGYGTNLLISNGAKIIVTGETILDYFNLKASSRHLVNPGVKLNAAEQRIVESIPKRGADFQEIFERSQVPYGELNLCLTTMEIKNIITKLPSGKFLINLTSNNSAG